MDSITEYDNFSMDGEKESPSVRVGLPTINEITIFHRVLVVWKMIRIFGFTAKDFCKYLSLHHQDEWIELDEIPLSVRALIVYKMLHILGMDIKFFYQYSLDHHEDLSRMMTEKNHHE